ncbi:MAG: hypothetical protein WC797_01135 [Candidatus Paceibacterota bacterium]|jgi:hypothetical protein
MFQGLNILVLVVVCIGLLVDLDEGKSVSNIHATTPETATSAEVYKPTPIDPTKITGIPTMVEETVIAGDKSDKNGVIVTQKIYIDGFVIISGRSALENCVLGHKWVDRAFNNVDCTDIYDDACVSMQKRLPMTFYCDTVCGVEYKGCRVLLLYAADSEALDHHFDVEGRQWKDYDDDLPGKPVAPGEEDPDLPVSNYLMSHIK